MTIVAAVAAAAHFVDAHLLLSVAVVAIGIASLIIATKAFHKGEQK
jgi:hypothetical protein